MKHSVLCCTLILTLAGCGEADTTATHAPDKQPVDLLITGGRIIDGLGSPPFRADLVIDDGRIIEVGSDAVQRFSAAEIVDATGRITHLGEAIASLPMAPDQAAAVLHGAKAGCGEDAARLVMLLQERGLGGRGEDLLQRLARWRGDRAPRSVAAASAIEPGRT